MAWQRSIPFGYQMTGGEIIACPEEAETVASIYSQYLRGGSYLTIAAAMSESGVRYHKATAVWNKHMVKRVLENPRYTGRLNYPPILPENVWSDAQVARDRKTAKCKDQPDSIRHIKRKIFCGVCGAAISKDTRMPSSGRRWWRCSNRDCSVTFSMHDEQLEESVTELLNCLIAAPELYDLPESSEQAASFEATRMQNEINRELGKAEINEEYLTSLIFACAAEKYAVADDGADQRKIAALKETLQNRSPLPAFDPDLFDEAAEALLVMADGSLALRVAGGNIIPSENRKENIDHADGR